MWKAESISFAGLFKNHAIEGETTDVFRVYRSTVIPQLSAASANVWSSLLLAPTDAQLLDLLTTGLIG